MASIEGWSTVVIFVIALLVYLNTFHATFAFDDNFAVLYNGDVTNDANPVLGLFSHDFWGQNIRSDMSHKSYRPLTVLSFRLMRKAWQLAPQRHRLRLTAWRKAREAAFRQDQGSQADPNLDPLLFHAGNALMHAVVSALMTRLAYYLFRRRLALLAAAPRAVPRPWRSLPQAARQTPAQDGGGRLPAPTEVERLILAHRKKMQARAAAAGEVVTPPAAGAPAAARSAASSLSTEESAAAAAAGTGGIVAAAGALPAAGAAAAAAASAGGLKQRRGKQAAPAPAAQSSRDRPTSSSSSFRAQVGQLEQTPGRAGGLWTPWQLLVQLHFPACLASLAFALHPAHTEAVAGIVGHAETLSAAFSIPALLLYFATVDGAVVGRCGATQHWLQVLLAVSLAWAAALSKEIGITIIGAMLMYDVLLVPLHGRTSSGGSAAAVAAGRGGGEAAAAPSLKWQRLVLLVAAGVAYVKMRSWVAVDQLIRIFRKVENPIPFSDSPWARVLTTGYLHARYTGLLLWPYHLSADWSYACIPIVETLEDPRNAATAALYLYLVVSTLLARPWRLVADWCRGGDCSGVPASVVAARWRLAVLSGLMCGPFFPASNVLFYVGTFIGERLLYFPSIGYCLLLAELAASVLGWATHAPAVPVLPPPTAAAAAHAAAATSDPAASAPTLPSSTGGSADDAGVPSGAGAFTRKEERRWTPSAVLLYLLVAALLLLYAGRTVVRNADWQSEETLFLAAQAVCNNSAKVQLNSGVLERRRMDYSKSLAHFRRAREIEPSYCEPDYWVGITLVNMGQVDPGIAELEKALSCKYVAAEATKTLNKLFTVMHQGGGSAARPDGSVLQRWASILLRPEVHRVGEGCDTLEQAALLFADRGNATGAAQCTGLCAAALTRDARGALPGSHLAVEQAPLLGNPLTELGSEQLLGCLTSRQPVYQALARHGAGSEATRMAVLVYLSSLLPPAPPAGKGAVAASAKDGGVWPLPLLPHHCRRTRSVAMASAAPARVSSGGLQPAQEQQQQQPSSNTPHMLLIHKVHSAFPEDPWLQLEWAQILIELGPSRYNDAATHLSVAAALLVRHQQDVTAGKPAAVATPSGAPLTAEAALGAAVTSLDRAAEVVGAVVRPAAAQRACEAQLQALEIRLLLAGSVGSPLRRAALGRDVERHVGRFRGQVACQQFRPTLNELLRRLGQRVDGGGEGGRV